MTEPAVSVCIPTRNGAAWIAETIASATSQDTDLEVVISDDASTDATVEIALASGDPRVHVEAAPRPLGMAANWNRAIALAQGTYVKLLMQDDALLPGALGIQQQLLERNPSAGFAFGPRLLHGDGSVAAAAWIAKYWAPHEALGLSQELISGRDLLNALLRRRLRANAIGEPSVVLMRMSALEQAGPFHPDLRQLTDMDMWIRLASIGDAAFDATPIALFRVHGDSATMHNRSTGDAWLDRLRIVDGARRRKATHQLVGLTHYAAAIAAGGIDVVRGLARRERSVAATWRELRTWRSRPPSTRDVTR